MGCAAREWKVGDGNFNQRFLKPGQKKVKQVVFCLIKHIYSAQLNSGYITYYHS